LAKEELPKKPDSTKKTKTGKDSEKITDKRSAGKDLAAKVDQKSSKAKESKVTKVAQESKAIKKKPASAPKLRK
jgi:hypothetical protein